MTCFFRVILIASLLSGSATTAVAAEKRLALLIGNQKYNATVGDPLQTPGNDVALLADKLKNIGFEVETLLDAKRTTLLGAVRKFADHLGAAGDDAIGVFYYAGHGASDPTGVNYIIPIDASQPDTTDFWDQSVKLDDITALMDTASMAARFIIFDACRNQLRLPKRSALKGFNPVDFKSGTFVAFSTAPNRTASDRESEDATNGPYAMALANEITRPSKNHLEIFHNVKMSLVTGTRDKQLPWENNGLPRLVVFTPADMPIPFNAAASPSFPCETYLRDSPLLTSHGRSPVSDLMCHDPGLARADMRMADAYDKLKRLLTREEKDKLEKVEHQQWRRARDQRCNATSWDRIDSQKFILIRCLNGELLLKTEEYEGRMKLLQSRNQK